MTKSKGDVVIINPIWAVITGLISGMLGGLLVLICALLEKGA